jgi:hypothetical protein
MNTKVNTLGLSVGALSASTIHALGSHADKLVSGVELGFGFPLCLNLDGLEEEPV